METSFKDVFMEQDFLTNPEDRLARRKQTGEDFTPSSLTVEMLNKLEEIDSSVFEAGKTFLDPACGNGNLLIWVYRKRSIMEQGDYRGFRIYMV